jgi:Zn-dependent protease
MGWASVPYDPHWALRYPGRAAIMSFAGPGANLLLALVAAIGLRIGLANGFFVPLAAGDFDLKLGVLVEAAEPGVAVGAGKLLSIVFALNLILLVLNLLPLPPLDGSSIIPLLISRESAAKFYH